MQSNFAQLRNKFSNSSRQSPLYTSMSNGHAEENKQNANVSLCEQLSIVVYFMMLPAEEVRRINQIPLRSEVETWKPS